MRQKLLLFTAVLMLFGITAAAENVGDVIGEVYPTDIVTDICGYKIPAYNIGGETAVKVSDLANYGFDVKFENGTAYADYNWQKEKTPVSSKSKANINVLYTDIKVKLNGIEVPSFNIDGSMAVPIERACETYLEANRDNEISDFFLNYAWCDTAKTLSVDISDDRISYQDFMIDLIKAAHMDFDSDFYKHYVKTDDEANPNTKYFEKFIDIKGTKLEEYINLLVKADLVDAYNYENSSKLHPYRSLTRTDAAFLISRILGCPAELKEVLESYDDGGGIGGDYISYYDYYMRNGFSWTSGYDADKVPRWVSPYFVYLDKIGVMECKDENEFVNPNMFITRETETKLINSMINYMEKGITNQEIKLVLYNYSVSKTKPVSDVIELSSNAQIADGILYVPWRFVYNADYNKYLDNNKADARKLTASKEKEIITSDFDVTAFNNHYLFSGDWGIVYEVFPGVSGYIQNRYSLAAVGYYPKYTELEYPIRKLYGEPMMPVYNYNTNSQLKTGLNINFNPKTNILSYEYNKTS